MNKFLCSIAVLSLFAPFASLGLGVGEIEVMSKLNEPLDARIELIYSSSTEAESAEVSLASQEDFDRIGLDRDLLGVEPTFNVVRNELGNFVIAVTTDGPVVEPFLDMLIEVEWESGRLLREYVVLLDPPVAAPTRTTPAITPAPEPVEEPVTAIEEEPTDYEAEAEPEPETAPEPISRPTAGAGAQTYGPVVTGDTLWEISRDWRPNNSISINQMMMKVIEMNPDAFYQDNINALRAGVILRLPQGDDFATLDDRWATQQVKNQNELWADYVGRVAGREVPTVSDAGADAEYDTSRGIDRPVADDSRLEIVPPGDDTSSALDRPGDGVSQADVQRMRGELTRAREELASARQENTELNDRVTELEDLIASMERAISLKDASLADLQAQLRQQQQGTSEPTPSATPEEPVEAEPEPVSSTPDQTEPDTTTVSTPQQQTPETAAPPQQTPQPKPRPTRPPKESLLSNPLVWGGGVLVLLILGGVGFMIYRRRQSEDSEFAVLETGGDEDYSEESYEPSPPAAHADHEDEEREDEAALVAAVDQDPNDAQNHLALLRHYYAAKNADSFVAAAEAMHGRVGGSHPAWMEVKAMGANLAPAAALFAEDEKPEPELDFDLGEAPEVPSTTVMESPTGEQAAAEADEDEGDDLDLDLDLGLDDGETGVEEAAGDEGDFDLGLDEDETGAEEAAGDEGDLDLDLDLDLDEEEESEAEEEDLSLDLDLEEDEEAAAGADEDLSLDLDMDEEATEPEVETAAADEDDLGDLDLDDLDLGEESAEADEGGTQFDLEALEEEVEAASEGDRSATDTAELELDLEKLEAEEDAGSEAEEEGDLDDLDLDLDDLDLSEESVTGAEDNAGTKLDLAKAYIDMGDPDGARGMLEEVIQEGSDEQKGEAQKLLDELNT